MKDARNHGSELEDKVNSLAKRSIRVASYIGDLLSSFLTLPIINSTLKP